MELLSKVAPYYQVPVAQLWQLAGHLGPGDAEDVRRIVAAIDPRELVEEGLRRGTWPEAARQAVRFILDAANVYRAEHEDS